MTKAEAMAPSCEKATVYLDEAEEAICEEVKRVADKVVPSALVAAIHEAKTIAICMSGYPYADLALKTMLERMGKDVDVIPCGFVATSNAGAIKTEDLRGLTIAEQIPEKTFDLQINHNAIYENINIRKRSAKETLLTCDKSAQIKCRINETLKQYDESPFNMEETWDETKMTTIPPDVMLCYAVGHRLKIAIDDEIKQFLRDLIFAEHWHWHTIWEPMKDRWAMPIL